LKTVRVALALALFISSCAHAPHLSPLEVHQLLALKAVGHVPFRPEGTDGKVVLIDFFATWCFPCLEDLPNLEALRRRYGNRGFEIVAIGMDLEGELVLGPFAEHYALPFPVLVASPRIREGQSPFGPIRELPTTVLLARDGSLLAAYTGVADPAALSRLVEQAL